MFSGSSSVRMRLVAPRREAPTRFTKYTLAIRATYFGASCMLADYPIHGRALFLWEPRERTILCQTVALVAAPHCVCAAIK